MITGGPEESQDQRQIQIQIRFTLTGEHLAAYVGT